MTGKIARVAFVSDSHFDRTRRFSECCRIHDWIADDMDRRDVGLMLHGGDLYERLSQPEERTAVGSFLYRVGHKRPVLIVRGNHDAMGDLRVLQFLGTPYPVSVEERSTVRQFEVNGVHLQVGAVAWPRASEILATDHPATDIGAQAAERMRETFRQMASDMQERPWPRILLMHAMVRDSTIGAAGQPLVGCDLEVGLDDIALVKAHFVALGHVHKAQEWFHEWCPIAYTGSPRRTDWGELEDKGYVIADFNEAGLVGWERILTPCARMVRVQWSPGADIQPSPEMAGSEVLLRYSFNQDDRIARQQEVDKVAETLRAAGALVTIEDVAEANVHARAPEVALATSADEKLVAFWKAKEISLEEAEQARLLGKLHQLQEEALQGTPDP